MEDLYLLVTIYQKFQDHYKADLHHMYFNNFQKSFVLNYCKNILDTESIKYEDKDINFIINQLYPDVRSIVNIMQKCSWEGILKINKDLIITHEKTVTSGVVEIISLIEKSKDSSIGKVVNSIIEILSKHDLEFSNIYTTLFFNSKIPAPAKIIVNKYSNSHQNCLVPHMHFMAMTFEIIKALQSYRKAVVGK